MRILLRIAEIVAWCISACYRFCNLFIRTLCQVFKSVYNFTLQIFNDYTPEFLRSTQRRTKRKKPHKCERSNTMKKSKYRSGIRMSKKIKTCRNRKESSNSSSNGFKFCNSEFECNLEKAKKVTITFEFVLDTDEKVGRESSKMYELVSASQTDSSKSDGFVKDCDDSNKATALNKHTSRQLNKKQEQEVGSAHEERNLGFGKQAVSNTTEKYDKNKEKVEQPGILDKKPGISDNQNENLLHMLQNSSHVKNNELDSKNLINEKAGKDIKSEKTDKLLESISNGYEEKSYPKSPHTEVLEKHPVEESDNHLFEEFSINIDIAKQNIENLEDLSDNYNGKDENGSNKINVTGAQSTPCLTEKNPLDTKLTKCEEFSQTKLLKGKCSVEKQTKFAAENITIADNLKENDKQKGDDFTPENLVKTLKRSETANSEVEQITKSTNVKEILKQKDESIASLQHIQRANLIEDDNSKQAEFPTERNDNFQIVVFEIEKDAPIPETADKIINYKMYTNEGEIEKYIIIQKISCKEVKSETIRRKNQSEQFVKSPEKPTKLTSLKTLSWVEYRTKQSVSHVDKDDKTESQNIQYIKEKKIEVHSTVQPQPPYNKFDQKNIFPEEYNKINQPEFYSVKQDMERLHVQSKNDGNVPLEILSETDNVQSEINLPDRCGNVQTEILPKTADVQSEYFLMTDANIRSDVLSETDDVKSKTVPKTNDNVQLKIFPEKFGNVKSKTLSETDDEQIDILPETDVDVQSEIPAETDVDVQSDINIPYTDNKMHSDILNRVTNEQSESLPKTDSNVQLESLSVATSTIESDNLKRSYTLQPEIHSFSSNTVHYVTSREKDDIKMHSAYIGEKASETLKSKIMPNKEYDTLQLGTVLDDQKSGTMAPGNVCDPNSQILKKNEQTMQSKVLTMKDDFVKTEILSKTKHENKPKIESETLCKKDEKSILPVTIQRMTQDDTKKHEVLQFKSAEILSSETPSEKINVKSFEITKKCENLHSNILPSKSDNVQSELVPKNESEKYMEKNIFSAQSVTLAEKRNIVQRKVPIDKKDLVQSKISSGMSYSVKSKIKQEKKKLLKKKSILSKNPSCQTLQKKNFSPKKLQIPKEKNDSKIQNSDEDQLKLVSCAEAVDFGINNNPLNNFESSNSSSVFNNSGNRNLFFDKGPSILISNDFLLNLRHIKSFDVKPIRPNFDFSEEYSMRNLNKIDVMLYSYFTKYQSLRNDFPILNNSESNACQIKCASDYNLMSDLPGYWDKLATDGDRIIVEKRETKCFFRSRDYLESERGVSENIFNREKKGAVETITEEKKDAIDLELLPTNKLDCNQKIVHSHTYAKNPDTSISNRNFDTNRSITEDDSSSSFYPSLKVDEDRYLQTLTTETARNIKESFEATQLFKSDNSLSSKNKNAHGVSPYQSIEIPNIYESMAETMSSKEKIVRQDLNLSKKNTKDKQVITSAQKFKPTNSQYKIFGDQIITYYPTLTADQEFLVNVRRDEDFKKCIDKNAKPVKFENGEEYLESKWNESDKAFFLNVMECEISKDDLIVADYSPKQSLGKIESIYDPMRSVPTLCDGISVKENKVSLGKRAIRCFSSGLNITEGEKFDQEKFCISQRTGSEELKIVKIPASSPPIRRRTLRTSDESNVVKTEDKHKISSSNLVYDQSELVEKTKVELEASIKTTDSPQIKNSELEGNFKKTEHVSTSKAENFAESEYPINDKLSDSLSEINNLPIITESKSEDDFKETKQDEYMSSNLCTEGAFGKYGLTMDEELFTSNPEKDNLLIAKDESQKDSKKQKLDWYEMTIEEEERRTKIESGKIVESGAVVEEQNSGQ